MLGSSQLSGRKRVRVTVEIFDDETQKILKSIKDNTSDREIISVRPANGQKPNASKRKRFAVPSSEEDPLPPARVSVFHPHTKTADETPGVTRPCTSKLEISREAPQNVTAVCAYCLQPSCIAFSPFKPQGRSDARITNHTKRRRDYKWYWRTLKDCGLWENPIYQQKKEELG